nr:ribonuclease H-like domain, reverse transcriptase, RNA-dependent DNA polymerase [Tanacetum cinerariifolium]
MSLTFAETHNMVAYLSKSDAIEGFNQIINFLNRSFIKYTLTVNPNIYVSCIKQFWTTVAVKQVNDVTRLQTLVDKKKVDEDEDADENVEEVNVGDAADGDVSAAYEEIPTVAAEPSIPSPTPPTPPPQPTHDIPLTSQKRMIAEMDQDDDVVLEDDKEDDREVADAVKDVEKDKVDESVQDQRRQAESQAKIYKIDLDHANKVLSMPKDKSEPAEVQEVVDVVTTAKLITKVVTVASETITAASAIITNAEAQVPAATTAVTLTATPKRVTAAPSRKRKGVVIRDLQEESTTSIIIPAKTKSKDKGKGILVKEPKPLKKKHQIKQDEQYARELHAELNNNIDWDEVIDHVKIKAKEDPAVKKYQALKRKPKTEEQIEEDENRALQKINETLAERAAKRRKLDEEIIELNNKPYYKIIRADDTHQLYVSFLILLRNFNKEDLEALWSLVKERFSTTKPKNFSDDILLVTLGEMFEKPADFVSREEVPTYKIHSRPDVECGKSTSTPIDTEKPLLKNPDAYSDSDYAGASLDRKSTTGGCQFLRCRLISWQCKKQTVVATSSTKVEYVAAAIAVHKCYGFRINCWIMDLIVFLLPKVESIRIGVNDVDLQVNHVSRLQALVDKKKVVVTEAIIWEALHLDDEEGVDCLANEEIFTELARVGYEKPSTKLTFYKAFFLSKWNLVRNVDSTNKFYMYPRFLQLMIRKQVGDLSTHTTKYTSPTLTQKVSKFMRRVGKGFSGVETPLFEIMLVEQQVDENEDADEKVKAVNVGDVADGDVSAAYEEIPTVAAEPSIPSPTPPTLPPQPTHEIPLSSQEGEETGEEKQGESVEAQKVRTSQRVETSDETVMDNESNQERMIAEMDQDDDVVLEDNKEDDREVADAVKDVEKDKVDESDKTEPVEVQKVVDVVTTAKLITEVVTAASETITAASAIITTAEAQVPAALTAVTLTAAPARVTAAPSRRRKGVVIRDLQEESTTSTIIPAETKSKDKVIDHVKIKAKEDPAVKKYQALKRKPKTEDELKRHLQIVSNEDDDVYTEATPLAQKVSVVDYQIIELNNKPYYKIIRADDTHQLYTCSNLEDSEKCTWSSKGQMMEATGIMWCEDHNIYIYSADFVSREEVPTHKIHSTPDVKCFKVKTVECQVLLLEQD